MKERMFFAGLVAVLIFGIATVANAQFGRMKLEEPQVSRPVKVIQDKDRDSVPDEYDKCPMTPYVIVTLTPGESVNASGIELKYESISSEGPVLKYYFNEKIGGWNIDERKKTYLGDKSMFAQLVGKSADDGLKILISKYVTRPAPEADYSICSRAGVYCGCSDFERAEDKVILEMEQPALPLDVR